jgi:hypothetical protein
MIPTAARCGISIGKRRTTAHAKQRQILDFEDNSTTNITDHNQIAFEAASLITPSLSWKLGPAQLGTGESKSETETTIKPLTYIEPEADSNPVIKRLSPNHRKR